MDMRSGRGLLVAGLLTLAVATGCSTETRLAAALPAATATAPAVHYVGSLTLSPDHGTAGTTVIVQAQGLPASTPLSVVWKTANGSWVLTGAQHEIFSGRSFATVMKPMGTATSDAAGNFSLSFQAPQDFGFAHDVIVQTQAGDVVNKGSFTLLPQFSISPTSGPAGTPITVTLDGVGYQYLYNSWFLEYDNKFTGWLSSVTTHGLAVAVVPATGAPGPHSLTSIEGAFTYPYINTQQSPAPKPTFAATFTVTGGTPVLPPPGPSQGFAPQPGVAPGGTAPAVWSDPQSAPVGQSAVLHGRGFPAGAPVQVTWGRVVGNRVGGSGWDEATAPLGTATAAADGTWSLPYTVPDDLGGTHALTATASGTQPVTGSFTLTTSAFAITPASGPVGTPIHIHLKGGGWTATANIYMVVYDNATVGYVCAFNSQGDVQLNMVAAGEPGYHYIDLYPAIYNGTDVQGVDDFRLPQLTFAQDHPGEHLPAFHFAFQVTQ